MLTFRFFSYNRLLEISLFISLLCSCAENESAFLYSRIRNLDTKGISCIDSSLLVTYDEAVIFAKAMIGDGDRLLLKVNPVLYEGYPTSYLIEYSDGWTIISADKRGPIVLAVSEESGVYDDMPVEALEWIEGLNADVAYRWSCQLPVNKDFKPEIESIDYWDSIIHGPEVVETKFGGGDGVITGIILLSEESTQVVFDSIPHLTNTLWHQNSPYNAACPFKRGSTSVRVPAGCGAIATSQLLFYLHGAFGTPSLAPASAECIGDIDNYTFVIPSPSSATIWNEMNNASDTSSNKAYILVADMAKKLNTVFTDTSGTTYFSDFQSALEDYGVYSSYTTGLIPDTLKVNLLHNLPVLMRGARFTSSGSEAGHFFLVDGYVRYRIETTCTYAFTWDPPRPIPLQGDYNTVTYSSPTIELVKMNWGWGSFAHMNDSYAPTGSWLADEGYLYDHGYYMISGFHFN